MAYRVRDGCADHGTPTRSVPMGVNVFTMPFLHSHTRPLLALAHGCVPECALHWWLRQHSSFIPCGMWRNPVMPPCQAAQPMQDVAVEPGNPHCFWSAAQDGRVHQFDLRCPDVGEATAASMLIQAPPSDGYDGLRVEFKSLDINNVRHVAHGGYIACNRGTICRCTCAVFGLHCTFLQAEPVTVARVMHRHLVLRHGFCTCHGCHRHTALAVMCCEGMASCQCPRQPCTHSLSPLVSTSLSKVVTSTPCACVSDVGPTALLISPKPWGLGRVALHQHTANALHCCVVQLPQHVLTCLWTWMRHVLGQH